MTVFTYTVSDWFTNFWKLEDNKHFGFIPLVEFPSPLECLASCSDPCFLLVVDYTIWFLPSPPEESMLVGFIGQIIIRIDGFPNYPFIYFLIEDFNLVAKNSVEHVSNPSRVQLLGDVFQSDIELLQSYYVLSGSL